MARVFPGTPVARRGAMRFAVAPLMLAAACTGELRELGMDAGPQEVARFAPAIQNDLDALNCTTVACHGGNGPPMHVTANASGAALAANYTEVKARASSGATSLL